MFVLQNYTPNASIVKIWTRFPDDALVECSVGAQALRGNGDQNCNPPARGLADCSSGSISCQRWDARDEGKTLGQGEDLGRERVVRVVLDGRSIQDHFPGIARYTYNLARELGRRAGAAGLDVLVDPTAPNRQYDLDRLARVSGVRLRPIVAPIFSLGGQARAALAVRSLRPDVYHSPYYVRPWLVSAPSVVTIHDLISETCPEAAAGPAGHLRRLIHHIAVGMALRGSRRTIVPCSATRSDVLSLYRVKPDLIAVIPEGVESRFGAVDHLAVAATRTRYQLPQRFVLGVGVNKPHKNLARLIEAFRTVSSEVTLVLAGPIDPRYPTGAALAHRFGLADRVMSLGPVADADLPGLYAAADVFAYPSLAEGFGLPPLEAMACGTPVVCSGTTSLPEVVGDAAVLCDPLDVSSLARALNQVLADQALRQQLVEAGRRRAGQLTWERAGEATWDLYRDVASQS
jgi:glycosyltransferase involved in cell wall biosynthesis